MAIAAIFITELKQAVIQTEPKNSQSAGRVYRNFPLVRIANNPEALTTVETIRSEMAKLTMKVLYNTRSFLWIITEPITRRLPVVPVISIMIVMTKTTEADLWSIMDSIRVELYMLILHSGVDRKTNYVNSHVHRGAATHLGAKQ